MALKAKIYIFALVASILVVISETKKPGKVMYFTSTKVEFNRIYISEHSLDIVGNTTLDIILNLAQNYKYDPWSKTVIAMKNRKTNEYRTLLDYDVNICSLLGKGSATYISMWIQNFLKYGNLPKTCPIMKGNYSWHDLKVDKMSLPGFLPPSEYRGNIETYFRKGKKRESVANITLLMELK